MMFALRRAALRAISRPTWQPVAISSLSRPASMRVATPAITRAFHQSRLWLAEEERKTPAENASTSPAESQSGIKEESILTGERAAESKEHVASTETPSRMASGSSVSEIAEKAKNAAANVAGRAQDALSGAAEEAKVFVDRRSGAPVSKNKILYVGNLFFEVTAPQLESEFSRYGEVVSSRVVTDNQGESKGFGFVEFASQQEADAAIGALDAQVFQGRRMTVQYHAGRHPSEVMRRYSRPNAPSDTLFIGNMSYQMSDRDLNDLFRDIRDVLDVRVAIDRRTGQPRGFAHADFIDVNAATRAKQFLEQKVIYGRRLRVDFGNSSRENRPRDNRDNE